MTREPIHFVSCDVCHAVSVHIGILGNHLGEPMRLSPDDPRAKLLCQITDPRNKQWGKPMDAPARVIGLVNVHGAMTVSESRSSCLTTQTQNLSVFFNTTLA